MHFKEEEEAPLHNHTDRGDESDGEDVESLDLSHVRAYPKTPRLGLLFKFFGKTLVWFTSVFVSGLIGAFLALHFVNIDQNCAAHTTQWSPLLNDVQIKYEFQHFDGNFMNESIYRQKGSPEVDAAWEALGVDSRAGIISHEDGLASGLDDSFVQRAEKHGGGFLVNVEGMHHLHCLNLVRKSLYFNFDYYKKMKMHAFQNDDDILHLHVTHCLDTIRQVLMCNVDTGVLGQVWVASDDPNDPIAFPDFNTRHVCKNYEDVRDWAVKLQAPPNEETPDDFLKLPSKEDIIPVTP
ncbi:Fc.00g008760.m01.CDS01 [Cosmosporella sp. VM-42]